MVNNWFTNLNYIWYVYIPYILCVFVYIYLYINYIYTGHLSTVYIYRFISWIMNHGVFYWSCVANSFEEHPSAFCVLHPLVPHISDGILPKPSKKWNATAQTSVKMALNDYSNVNHAKILSSNWHFTSLFKRQCVEKMNYEKKKTSSNYPPLN